MLTDIVDSSGFKMHFTKNLRQYDAGMLQIGRLSIWDLAIPPNQESFEVEGDCSSTCIEKVSHCRSFNCVTSF